MVLFLCVSCFFQFCKNFKEFCVEHNKCDNEEKQKESLLVVFSLDPLIASLSSHCKSFHSAMVGSVITEFDFGQLWDMKLTNKGAKQHRKCDNEPNLHQSLFEHHDTSISQLLKPLMTIVNELLSCGKCLQIC